MNEKEGQVEDLKSCVEWRGFERKLMDGAFSGPASPPTSGFTVLQALLYFEFRLGTF